MNLLSNKYHKFLFIIILLGTFLRFYNLGISGSGLFTNDEVAQFRISSNDFNNIIKAIISDDFAPPLYHFLLHFWLYLGKTEFIARSFSALLGVLSIPMIYLIGKELYNEKVGLFSALLIATSPLSIWASQIARNYSLFLLMTLCSVYYFIKILNNPDSGKKVWFGYIASTLMMMYAHYFAFLIVITENFLAVLFGRNKKSIKYWIYSQVSLLILYIPWLPFLFLSLSRRAKDYLDPPTISIMDIAILFEDFSISILHPFNSWRYDIIILILAMVLYPILFAKGLYELQNKLQNKRSSGIIISSFFFIPLILSFLFAYKIGAPASRYLIYILFAYFIIISLALSKIKDLRILTIILACIFLISIGTIHQNQAYFRSIAKNDLPAISDFINSNSEENDVILISENQALEHIKFYYTGRLKMHGLPEDLDKEMGLDSMLSVTPDNLDMTIRNVQNYTKGHERFWFIYLNWNDKPQLISKIRNDINKNNISDVNINLVGSDMVIEYFDNNYRLIMKNETISEKYKVYLYENT